MKPPQNASNTLQPSGTSSPLGLKTAFQTWVWPQLWAWHQKPMPWYDGNILGHDVAFKKLNVHPNLVEVAGKGAMCGRELVDLMSLTICGSSWNHLQEYDSIMTWVLIEGNTHTHIHIINMCNILKQYHSNPYEYHWISLIWPNDSTVLTCAD